jgi:hypothetical protein
LPLSLLTSLVFHLLSTGDVRTVAGSSAGYQDGYGSNAKFQGIIDMVVVGDYLYASDFSNNVIRVIDATTGTRHGIFL